MSPFFTDGPFYRKLARLALPISLQALLVALVAASDAAMLGRVNQNAMAAVSLATQVQFLQNMGVFAVTTALSLLGAQYWGKGDRESMGKLFRIGLRTVGCVSLTVAALCVFAPRALMHVFAKEGPLVDIGAGYLRIAGLSYLLTGVTQCHLAILKVTDRAALSAWIGGGAVGLNIALNAVFIYGLGPIPELGARGAAIATLVARAAELVAAMLSTRAPNAIRACWRRLFERTPELSGDFRRAVLPLFGGVLFWGCGFASYTAVHVPSSPLRGDSSVVRPSRVTDNFTNTPARAFPFRSFAHPVIVNGPAPTRLAGSTPVASAVYAVDSIPIVAMPSGPGRFTSSQLPKW